MNQNSERKVERGESEILLDIVRLTPKVTDYYVYDEEGGQKAAFLADGQVRETTHEYSLLMEADFTQQIDELARIHEEIVTNPGIDKKFLPHYLNFVNECQGKYDMLQLVQDYHLSTDETERARIKTQYIETNSELYGAPERDDFDSIVKDTYDRLDNLTLTGRAAEISDELHALLKKPEVANERFRPSPETVEWLGKVVDVLYGGLLQHVPAPTSEEIVSEKSRLCNPTEIKRIFEIIIQEEFGESAADWRVHLVPSGPIEVDRINKRINIPMDKAPVTRGVLRGLIVHELGVHFLRGIMGYEMDNPMHALGFRDYRILEEGAGVANQQALNGKYTDSGDQYYLVASLMELEGKNKRDTFEIMWRYIALKRLEVGGALGEKEVAEARSKAYDCINRMTKGMEDTPSNMDLSYYFGSGAAWQYYEKNRGDADAITRFFMSRLNTAELSELELALDARQFHEHIPA